MSLLDRELPEPDFVVRDPAQVVADMVAQYEALTGKTLQPAQLEQLQINVFAYRESLMREAMQDAAKQNLVRYARAPMLDMLGEQVGVARLTDEQDDALRERIVLSWGRFSVAGPAGAYAFWARSAHPDVLDAAVVGPQLEWQNGALVSANGVPPGVVRIYPLCKTGLPTQAVLDAVLATCSADDVRPLTDWVQVLAPVQRDFAIDAGLVLYRNADAQVALAAAQKAIGDYVSTVQARLGADVVLAQVVQALKIYGVYDVVLQSPAQSMVVGRGEWAHCTGVTIAVAGRQEG